MRDPKGSDGKLRRILAGALFGVAFGALFPLVSTVIALLDAEQSLTLGNAFRIHKSSPLLQVIDTIPLLMGVTFALLGRAMARLDDFIENLEGTVVQRDLVLQRAQSQATAARKAKGALLAQFVSRMQERFAKGESSMQDLLNAGLPLELQRSLKAVATSQRKVKTLLWDLEMLATVEDEATSPSEGERCNPQTLCEQTLAGLSEREHGSIRYRVASGDGVPPEIQVSQARVARTLTCLLQCAVRRSAQMHLEVTLSHFAASHGGNSQIHVAIRSPSTPTSNSVVRCFADLDPNAKGEQNKEELELALCRQLALTHYAEVGVRPDPKGGMSYWLMFPYHQEDEGRGPPPTQSAIDSQEMVDTRIAAA